MQEDLEIEIEEHAQGPVLRLKGSAGIAGGHVLEIELAKICARKPQLVVLDLSGVTMVASLAMGQLISAQRSIVRTGGKLRLAAVPAPVMGSFKHARLDSVFQCFDTVALALAA